MMRTRPNRKPLTIVVLSTALALTMPAHAQSEADCAARADRAARSSSGVVGGAVGGGAGGAGIGAIVSGSRKGTRRGAAIGAVVGGTTAAVRKNERYKRVYDDCMARR